MAADGHHRAGRAGHGRALHSRAGRHGRQQQRGGRSRHNRVQAGRRGRQEAAAAAAGYAAPEDAYGAPEYEVMVDMVELEPTLTVVLGQRS